MFLFLLVLLVSASLSASAPVSNDTQDFFEEDIILTDEQKEVILNQEEPIEYYREIGGRIWPRGILSYDLAPGEFNARQTSAVLEAMSEIERYSCVRFARRTAADPTYILLRNRGGQGCASTVGYVPSTTPVDLFLNGDSCFTRGTIQHELLHALGFWHEHTRLDRDRYITILWRNVLPGKEYNFMKRSQTEELPYDYGSVMHYRPAAFSRDGSTPTLVATIPASATSMGQRVRASNLDFAKLNRLYQCPYPYYRGDEIIAAG